MTEQVEFRGHWWLPESEDSTAGVATFDIDDGIQLDLFSTLAESGSFDEFPRHDRVFGITTDAELITLNDCIQSGGSMQSAGGRSVRTSSYTANQLLVGQHFESNEISFSKFRIKFPFLQEWIGRSGVQMPTGDEFEIKYSSPEDIYTEADPWILEFLIKQSNSFSFGDISLSEDAYIQIGNLEDDLTLDNLNRQITVWKNFITLALDEEIFPSQVIGYTESESGREGKRIEIMSSAYRNGDMPTSYPRNVNFEFSDIEQNISGVLSNWVKQSDKYASAYGLYFSVVYQSPMQIENQYLILSSALESFYQETTEDPIGLAAEDRLDEVLTAIVSEYEDVLSYLPWELEEVVPKIFEMRDSIMHGMEIDSDNSMTLYDQVLFLQALLEAAFLTELGIPKENTQEKLNNKYTRQRPFVVTENTNSTSET